MILKTRGGFVSGLGLFFNRFPLLIFSQFTDFKIFETGGSFVTGLGVCF
jgi:hypothetical protein